MFRRTVTRSAPPRPASHPAGPARAGRAVGRTRCPILRRGGARSGPEGSPPGSRTSRGRTSPMMHLSLIHISEPTRLGMISYAVFCLKKKKNKYDGTLVDLTTLQNDKIINSIND